MKPWIEEARLRIVGEAPLPAAVPVDFGDVLTGGFHGQRVRIEGTVRDVVRGGVHALLLCDAGRHLEVEVQHGGPRVGPLALDWYRTRMAVTGVVVNDVDTHGHPSLTRVLVKDEREVRVLERYPTNLFALPVRRSGVLGRGDAAGGGLVKLEGTVLHDSVGHRVFVRDADGAFEARALELLPQRSTRVLKLGRPPTVRFEPGDRVEVVGVAEPGGQGRVLVDAEFRRTGGGPVPEPVRMGLEALLETEANGELVRMKGRVVGQEARREGGVEQEVLRLQTGRLVYEVVHERHGVAGLPTLGTDTVVEWTGLGVVSRLAGGGVRSLRVLLRRPEELVVLGQAAWWERVPPERVVWFTGMLGTVAGGWIVFLRRQVRQRRRAEGVAREQNEELERRIGERTAELVAANARLQESEERFSRAFRNTPALLTLMGLPEGRLLEVNAAFLGACGLREAEVIGRRVAELGIWVDTFEPEGFLRELLDRGCVRAYETRVRNREGREEVVLLSAEKLELGGRACALCHGVVVTERKRAERELVRALAQERELSELKGRFVAMVSHEFRTPLGVITSSAEILGVYHDRLDAEERASNLEDITEATRHMTRMMDDVLLIGRAEAGRLECRSAPLDLAGLIRRVLAEQVSATGKGNRVLLDLPSGLPLARGDESLVRHILANLVSNAVKYSPDGAPVVVRLRERGGVAFLRVRDRGIGIPEEDQRHLFEAFHRGRNVGVTPGTGLGMSIVRHCVAAHGGVLRFHSREGAGSCFRVMLPLFGGCLRPVAGVEAGVDVGLEVGLEVERGGIA